MPKFSLSGRQFGFIMTSRSPVWLQAQIEKKNSELKEGGLVILQTMQPTIACQVSDYIR